MEWRLEPSKCGGRSGREFGRISLAGGGWILRACTPDESFPAIGKRAVAGGCALQSKPLHHCHRTCVGGRGVGECFGKFCSYKNVLQRGSGGFGCVSVPMRGALAASRYRNGHQADDPCRVASGRCSRENHRRDFQRPAAIAMLFERGDETIEFGIALCAGKRAAQIRHDFGIGVHLAKLSRSVSHHGRNLKRPVWISKGDASPLLSRPCGRRQRRRARLSPWRRAASGRRAWAGSADPPPSPRCGGRLLRHSRT